VSTTFHKPINNVSTTVGATHTPLSVSLVVASGSGSRFGSIFPLIITASRSGTVLSILNVTGRNSDTLTISEALEGTSDVDLQVGDKIEMRPTALAITELQDAINGVSTDLAGKADDTSVVHLSGTETITGGKTFTADTTFDGMVVSTHVGKSDYDGYVAYGLIDPGTAYGAYVHCFGRDSNVSSGQAGNVFVIADARNSDSASGRIHLYQITSGGSRTALEVNKAGDLIFGGALLLPTLADSAAPNGSIYFGSDHSSQLCRKDSSGTVTVIG
jgi:hypothetical protein